MTTSTQQVTFKATIDVLDADGVGQRICITDVASIPVVDVIERAGTIVDIGYEWAPRTIELYGIEGSPFRSLQNHVGVEPSPSSDVVDPAAARIYSRLPEKHSITGGRLAAIHTGIVGRWGTDDLQGYDLGAATTRVEGLRRAVEENFRIHHGRLFYKAMMPTWHADLSTGKVWSTETRWADYSACPSTTFGAGRLDEAVRMVREMTGFVPEVRGEITGYEPRFDVPEEVRMAREVGEWMARMTADEVVALPAELVRGWRRLRDAAGDDGPTTREDGLQVVRDAAAYAEAILGTAGLAISDSGNGRGRLFRGIIEDALTSLNWRIAELDPAHVAGPHAVRGPAA